MKRTVKRSICLLLVLLLALSMVMTAGAADLTEEEAKNYTITMQSTADESRTYSATGFWMDEKTVSASFHDIPAGDYKLLVYYGEDGASLRREGKITLDEQMDISFDYQPETDQLMARPGVRYDVDGKRYYLQELRDGVVASTTIFWWTRDEETGGYSDGPLFTIQFPVEQTHRVVDQNGTVYCSETVEFNNSDSQAVSILYGYLDEDGNFSEKTVALPGEINSSNLYVVLITDQDDNEVDRNYCHLASGADVSNYVYATLFNSVEPGEYNVWVLEYNVETGDYVDPSGVPCELTVTGTEPVAVLVRADSENNYDPEPEVLRYTANVYLDGKLVNDGKACLDASIICGGGGTWRYELYRDGELQTSQSAVVDREDGLASFAVALDYETGDCDVTAAIYPAEINLNNFSKVTVTDQTTGKVAAEVFLDNIAPLTGYCAGIIRDLPAGKYRAALSIYSPQEQGYEVLSEKELVLTGTEDVTAVCRRYDLYLSISADQTFDDVSADYWAGDAIRRCVGLGLFNGTSASAFSPTAAMSRQALMTVLARLYGQNASTTADGMTWAVKQGISDGKNPTDAISRQQLATMLYRFAGEPDTDGTLDAFSDARSVAGYAVDAMRWAVANGIIVGTDDGRLNPNGTATRAQIAVMVDRYVDMIG